MLASVLPRSRPVGFQLLKMEGPKGEAEVLGRLDEKGLRWGMEPARNLDNKVEDRPGSASDEDSAKPGDGVLLKGLVEGAGRAACCPMGGTFNIPLPTGAPGNRDGTVPARARLPVEGMLSGVGSWLKSGKPSVGDSGMFSRRGVEFPLVGGPPQRLLTGKPGTPSWA